MDDNSVIPENHTDELEAINAVILKSVRKAQKHQPNITTSTIMKQFAVCELMNHIEQQINRACEHPPIFFSKLIYDEYQEKEFWTFSEASSLAAGFDPLFFEQFPSHFAPKSHERHTAVWLSMKPIFTEFVVPKEFCKWALVHGFTHGFVTDFFHDIKHRY